MNLKCLLVSNSVLKTSLRCLCKVTMLPVGFFLDGKLLQKVADELNQPGEGCPWVEGVLAW